jgi:hypothetical protein
MNYSRRQLYALGEPLGDSVTVNKVGGGRIYGGGGGGGGGGPQQSTTYNTNIPEYAKPYVTTMLGATQKQLFEGTPTEEGGYDITGFRGYKPYSTDVNNYFAGFSPMQQQAQQATGQLQVPGEYGQATQMTGLAGLGALGLSGQMANAGQNFAQQAQDPMAMQGYMSPYMQNVVDYQKSQALRDYNIARPMRAKQAIGQGAFGGSRQAIMEAEAERSLGSQLQGIAATGSQKAFEDAQRQQQFGAQLGLQGQQAGLQGLGQFGQMANQLGQLGGARLGAQRDIIGMQSQMGKEQQALEQAKINQAIQDYATQQQYPLMQLGFMSNMLRGLPMQATTTQSYQAMPSTLNQGLGVLAGAAGARQAGLFAEGGTIKGLAAGGVTNYANRGMVQSNPDSSVVRGIRAKLEMMPADQLQKVAQTSPSEEIRAMAIQILQEQKVREQAEAQAEQSIAQDQQRGLPTPVTERAGLPAAPAGAMDTLSAASGGIVAFADEGQVNLDEEEAARLQQEFASRQKYADFYKRQREAAGVGAPKAGLGEFYAKEQASLADAEKQARGYDLLNFGVNLASQAGPLMYAGAKAGQATLPGIIARQEGLRGRRGDVAKGLAEVAEGERLMKLGDITGGNAMFEKAEERLTKERVASTRASISDKADNHARGYLADARAKNDNRPEEIILLEGRNDYLTKVQQAQLTRADVAAQNVVQTGQNLTRDDANKEIATVGTPGYKDYKAKMKARKAEADWNKLTPAEKKAEDARINAEVRDKILARNQSGGGSNKPKASSKANPAQFDADNS